MESRTSVAVVQAGSLLFDIAGTLVKTTELARDAASRGAKIVLFPEAFIGGYPKGMDFGARDAAITICQAWISAVRACAT